MGSADTVGYSSWRDRAEGGRNISLACGAAS